MMRNAPSNMRRWWWAPRSRATMCVHASYFARCSRIWGNFHCSWLVGGTTPASGSSCYLYRRRCSPCRLELHCPPGVHACSCRWLWSIR
jgi:hypothetical protein